MTSSNSGTSPSASEVTASALPTSASKSASVPLWLPPLFYLILSLVFLYRSIFTGSVFLPADLLLHAAPFTGTSMAAGHVAGQWNPLRWDGIAQFYPWRHFAAQAIHSGTLPLWNPYQLSGTPFVANSQSAPFYPGNFLFYVMPVMRAFAFSAVFHLTLAGWFTYLLARRLKCSEAASLFAGTAFAFSAWQVCWLQLPSFLATSCWIPLALAIIHALVASHKKRARLMAGLALSVGMMLLAGHLQIAFYGLLAAGFWTAALIINSVRNKNTGALPAVTLAIVAGFVGGGLLAAPQLLPAVELSKISHRVSKPSAEGYALYTGYALPRAGLVQLALPGFFGGDTDPENKYWGFYTQHVGDTDIAIRHNAAETAVYVGIVTLLLGLYGVFAAALPGGNVNRFRTLFFGLLAVVALLLALGTPLNYLTYFGIPGFSQSGSPARVLVLWALTWAMLGAFGVDALGQTHRSDERVRIAAIASFFLLTALGLSSVATALSVQLPGFKPLVPMLGEALTRAQEDAVRLVVIVCASFQLMLPGVRKKLSAGPAIRPVSIGGIALLLAVIDLFAAGMRINPVSSPEVVYPVTPGIAYLQKNTGHERIMPVNLHWSLYSGPKSVLPPNAGMVYGLRDVQGYDSLMPGAYKAWANRFTIADSRPGAQGRRDSSPVEVANMIFFQDPNSADVPETAALFAITPNAESWNPDPGQSPSGQHVGEAQDAGMEIYRLPGKPRAEMLNGSANWVEDGLNRVTLATMADTGGTLLLRDQRYPGWRAYIDTFASSVPIQGDSSNPAMRKVSVGPGKHTVYFRFEPASATLGIYLALACLAGCTGIFIGTRKQPSP